MALLKFSTVSYRILRILFCIYPIKKSKTNRSGLGGKAPYGTICGNKPISKIHVQVRSYNLRLYIILYQNRFSLLFDNLDPTSALKGQIFNFGLHLKNKESHAKSVYGIFRFTKKK